MTNQDHLFSYQAPSSGVYSVDNAVILAAGEASRFAPLSFEKPKPMFEVRGEILIDRMIRQLKEAGISQIYVVVGYMSEEFDYLKDVEGVEVVFNPAYADMNNFASLYAVADKLANSYICSADQYYTENIFASEVPAPYCSAVRSPEPGGERILVVDGVLDEVGVVESNLRLQGPFFLNEAYSKRLTEILADAYADPACAHFLWDELLAAHLDEFKLQVKIYEPGVIYEFNYLNDLRCFDTDFFENVDSTILDNICNTLQCKRDDISGVYPFEAGLSNLSVLFEVGENMYVYRHPGAGTNEIIDRANEARALELAKELGLDSTYLFADPQVGWKISTFVDGCVPFDYENPEQVEKALSLVRKLHTSGVSLPVTFDYLALADEMEKVLNEQGWTWPQEFDALRHDILCLDKLMEQDRTEPVFCHNDFYGPNILVTDDDMQLIDWEYAGMCDYANDLGSFIAQGSGYDVEQTIKMLPLYYGRMPSPEEARHVLGAVGLVGYFWFVWSQYKASLGNPMDEWARIWFDAAQTFSKAAFVYYQE